MTRLKRYRAICNDGSIESYNKIAEKFPREYFQLDFIDKQYHSTNVFTGSFRIFQFSDIPRKDHKEIVNNLGKYAGLILNIGDFIEFEVDEVKDE